MASSKINPTNPLTLYKFPTRKPNYKSSKPIKVSCYYKKNPEIIQTETTITSTQTQLPRDPCNNLYNVSFKTLGAGKLGISRFPDFEYDSSGGSGSGIGTKIEQDHHDSNLDLISVRFNVEETLYIPPLTNETTKFLGLPLPPFLRIDILPEIFQGFVDLNSGKVELEFTARFCFSAGGIYRAPPLVVKTVLTSEESRGEKKRGRGKKMDGAGNCRLVGIAKVEPIKDLFMNFFLGLPTKCLADLGAIISVTDYQTTP